MSPIVKDSTFYRVKYNICFLSIPPFLFSFRVWAVAGIFHGSSSCEVAILSMVPYTVCQSSAGFQILWKRSLHELQKGTSSRCPHFSRWWKLPVFVSFSSLFSSLVFLSYKNLILWFFNVCLNIYRVVSIL